MLSTPLEKKQKRRHAPQDSTFEMSIRGLESRTNIRCLLACSLTAHLYWGQTFNFFAGHNFVWKYIRQYNSNQYACQVCQVRQVRLPKTQRTCSFSAEMNMCLHVRSTFSKVDNQHVCRQRTCVVMERGLANDFEGACFFSISAMRLSKLVIFCKHPREVKRKTKHVKTETNCLSEKPVSLPMHVLENNELHVACCRPESSQQFQILNQSAAHFCRGKKNN